MKPAQPSELRQAVGGLRPFFVRASWFTLIAGVLALAPSAYMLEVYDRVLNSRNLTTLVMLTLLVVAVYVILEVLEWARGEIMYEAGRVFERSLSTRVFEAMFMANLRKASAGNLQPMADLRVLRDALGSPVVSAVMEAPVSLLYLVLIFAMSPVLGWAAVVGAVLQVGIGWLNERSTQPPLSQAARESMAAQQYADGSLRNAEVIESMGMLRDIHRRWLEKQRKFLSLQALASERAGGYQAVTKFLSLTLSSLLLGLAAWLLLHDMLNGGGAMLVVASILGARVLAPLVQVVTQWRTVVGARDAWARLDALLKGIPAKDPQMALPQPKGVLQVESVTAGPPGSQTPIVRGLSFAVAPGEVLAVIGPSASGKTSLARLLVGIWPAAMGKVRLDGADIFQWDKAELGPHLGYLPQDVELFEGTLAENIARFGEIEPAKVEAAARAVGLHEYILSLPQGYETAVGADGSRLSGGQRQRVALARAIYGNPTLVVLDEPNSSLDEVGDAALAAAISQLKATGTTFVVMTHRTSVLAVTDKLLVLRDGQAQAFGPRDEVLAALAKANANARPPQKPPAKSVTAGAVVPQA